MRRKEWSVAQQGVEEEEDFKTSPCCDEREIVRKSLKLKSKADVGENNSKKLGEIAMFIHHVIYIYFVF